jgi:hypothetical protein
MNKPVRPRDNKGRFIKTKELASSISEKQKLLEKSKKKKFQKRQTPHKTTN